MTFEIEIGGRVRVVSIEGVGPVDASGGRFRVVIADDAPGSGAVDVAAHSEKHEVDARRTELGVSIIHTDTGQSVDAVIAEQPSGEYLIQVRGVRLAVVVDGRRSRRQQAGAGQGTGEQRLTAPMPGRIVRVMVKPGDEVAARQGLVVIEAMKMENELVSARAGRVAEVAVVEGTSVEAGRLLVRLE